MSHSEPWQRDLEGVLRRALRTAADSVEPGADGLDRIRSRIRARQRVLSSWAMADLAGPAGLGSLLSSLRSTGIAARAALHAAAQWFGPGTDRIGWYRWLRPAAALATGVLVVLAGSLAITALPQVIASSASHGSVPGSGGGGAPVASGTGLAVPRTGSQSPVTSPGTSSPASHPAPHRGNSTANASPPSASPTVPASSSPSPSPTPPASSSPSPSPTPPASCPPSASPTPSASSSRPNRPHCRHRGHHKPR
jgi:hypothetical protein